MPNNVWITPSTSGPFCVQEYTMAERWYVKTGNKVHGPMSSTRLKSLARSGKLTDAMSVGKSEDGPWVEAHAFPGLLTSGRRKKGGGRPFDSTKMAERLYSELPLFRKAHIASGAIALCLFSEIAFAVCRGLAKVTDSPGLGMLFVGLLLFFYLCVAVTHGVLVLVCISLLTGDVYYDRLVEPQTPVLDKWSRGNKLLAPVFGLAFLLGAFEGGYMLFRLLFIR